MNIRTTGRKVNLKENFIAMVEKRLAKFDRFFDEDAEGQVTVTVENNRQTVEITLKSRGLLYRSERTSADMESAFNEAADLIGRQIIRNKEKLGTRIKQRSGSSDYEDFGFDAQPADDEYRIVREKRFPVKPMTVEEAVLRMNMLSHNFFVFLNSETESVCVVYHRDDNDYGLLVPELS